MAMTTWQALADLLDPIELTVRAQALPPTDLGTLIWDTFFPRQNVNSVRLADLYTIDYRPTADRREWNAKGRRIPNATPARREVRIIPVESNFRIDEEEMQALEEQAGGNRARVLELAKVSIPARIDQLVDSNYRRVEVDAVTAWTAGTVTQKNPENGQTYVSSFGFAAGRLNTAGTAWDNVGVNAYDLLQAWIVAAQDLVGPIEGVMLRLATMNAILADAPNLQNSVKMTRTELADRITQDAGQSFQFFVNEQSVDIFDDGGLAYTRTKVWPAQKIAAVPVGKVVGRTAFAPVVRAGELANVAPSARIDQRGVAIYRQVENGGRGLAVEAQFNPLTIPDESKVYVTNVGV